MALTIPFPLQKSDIEFGYDATYEMMRSLGGPSDGVVGASDFVVTAKGTPNMSVDVAAGYAWLQMDTPSYAGVRSIKNPASQNSGTPGSPGADWLATFTAAHATLPRIDRVVLIGRDGLAEGGANYNAKMSVLAGTATSGATLANLTGAATPPGNSMLLANVLVPAAATSITSGNIDSYGDGYSGGIPVRPRMDAVRMCSCAGGRNADVALSANTVTDVSLDFETFDLDNMINLSDQPKVTLRTPGYYAIRARAEFAYNASGGYRGVLVTAEDATVASTYCAATAVASVDTRIEATMVGLFGAASNRRWVKPQVVSNIALNLLYMEIAAWCISPVAV